MKRASKIFTACTFLLLYVPLLVMIVFSFNSGKSTANFQGFDLRWYIELLSGGAMLDALRNSLVLAVLAALISTVLGLVAALGIFKMKNRYLKATVNSVTNVPMMNPDIVTGVSMLLFFVFVGTTLGYTPYRNFFTVLIAHVTFCLPYVILSIMPKLHQMDKNLTEAALDLGCTPMGAFFRIEFPAILPGILSGFIMAFTLSLDDFVISNFTCGQGFQTLPVYIYNMIKKRVTPDVYALYTIIFLLILALLFISNMLEARAEELNDPYSKKNIAARKAIAAGENPKNVNQSLQKSTKSSLLVKIVAGVTACVLVVLSVSSIFVNTEDEYAWVEYIETPYAGTTLYVYNWGEYIADGSDGSMDLVRVFEEMYDIDVVYSTFDTNEKLYSDIKSGAGVYDVVIPSDYMIERLLKEDLLQPINTDNLKNYHLVDDRYKDLYYDPTNSYSVPYNVGMVGIVYNTAMIDEKDAEKASLSILWDGKYKGNILQFDGPRDGFATAQILLGIDLNTHDKADWDRAYRKLIEQKSVFQGYVMDQIFAKMEGESAAVAPYYAGDCLSMMEENENLAFYYPVEGTNIFVDAMCIPKTAQNVGAAELFIDFLCRPEISGQNMNALGYSTPITAAKDYMDPEMVESELAYPSEDVLVNATSYAYLPEEIVQLVESLFQEATKLIN